MPAHVGPRHGGSNQPRVSWRVCRELQPSGDQCRNLRPLPSCSEDMLWSGATAVTLSCCHAVMLSYCHAVTRPNTGHLAQDTSTHCKSLLTLIYNSALRAGAGRVLIGNISSVLTLHCVLWLLVCGGWCRPVLTGGFLAVSLPPAS